MQAGLVAAMALLAAAGCTPPSSEQPHPGAPVPAGAAPSADSLAPPSPLSPLSSPAAAEAARPANAGSGVLTHPTNVQMVLLAYRLGQKPPPLAAWAAQLHQVRLADEFSRGEKLRVATAGLQQAYDQTAGIGVVVIRISGYLSEYDAGNGGFYLSALQPGSVITFNGLDDAANDETRLVFDNAAAANLWHIDARAAQAAFERNGRARGVDVDVTARVVAVEADADTPILHAIVQRYEVFPTYTTNAPAFGSQEVASR